MFVTNIFKPFFLLFIFSLCGCNYISQQYRSLTNYQLQGEIYAQSEIPENSLITISLNSVDGLSSVKNNVSNYQITTEGSSKIINFVIYLADELVYTTKPVELSIRIEKDGELLMMSQNMTSLSKNLSEKLSIPVIKTH